MDKFIFRYGDQDLWLESEECQCDGSWSATGRGFSAEVIKRIKGLSLVPTLYPEITRYTFRVDFRTKHHDLYLSVVKDLSKVAAILREASGEIECRIYDEAGALHEDSGCYYEYYTVSQGILWRQPGRIIRAKKEVVEESQET